MDRREGTPLHGPLRIDDDATLHLPARTIAAPQAMSDAARTVYVQAMRGMLAAGAPAEVGAAGVAAFQQAAAAAAAETVRAGNERVLRTYAARTRALRIAGVPVTEIVAQDSEPGHDDCVLINLHGGAFILNSGSLVEAVPVAHFSGMRVLAIDYRMPPAHPFPAALDDVEAVYRELLATHASGAVGIFGTSAGAALTASATLRLRQAGMPLPGAVCMVSFGDGDTAGTLDGLDPYLGSWGPAAALTHAGMLSFYAPGHDLHDGLIGPLHGDYTKPFPPALLIGGTRGTLLGGTVRLHRKLREAGREAELEVWDGMWHAFNADPIASVEMPEAAAASRTIAEFFRRRLRRGGG